MGAIECCTARDQCESARTHRSDITPRLPHGKEAEQKKPHCVPSLDLQGTVLSKSVTQRSALADKTNTHHRVLGDKTNTQEIIAGGLDKKVAEELPSRGSAQHEAGQCKRCCFYPRGRCTNGYDCEFCHYDHEKRTHRKRRNKKGRTADGLEIDLDDASDEAGVYAGLEIQLPTSPDSFTGDAHIASWSSTPSYIGQDGSAALVPSCLYTMPVETTANTTAVPVYTWVDGQSQTPARPWETHGSEYALLHGEGFQIHNDSGHHGQLPSHQNRFLPVQETGRLLLPEPPPGPLTLHQWQDAGDRWQDQGCATWPSLEAGWEYSSNSESQSWEWNAHMQGSYFEPWSDCNELVEERAMPAGMCWNSHTAEMTAVDEHGDMHIPEYMPGIKCFPATVLAPEASSLTPKKALPPGVEVATDMEPPPLSPGAPASPSALL